jgi:DnaJ-class molecular chaperone
MEDYYRLLDIHYDASIDELNDAYKNKIYHFKSLPFLTNNDKEQLKNIKKAYIVFNNSEYKKIYDQYIQNKFKKEVNIHDDTIHIRKKNIQNPNYIIDRIFGQTNNQEIVNIKHNELLRPKNVGLSSDNIPTFDKPLDFKESTDFLPHNYDGNISNLS